MSAQLWCAGPAYGATYWDTLDGPIGIDARQSLDTGDVGHVLKWVQLSDEPAVRAALQKVRALRAQYPEHVELLDRTFFGTLLTLCRGAVSSPESLDCEETIQAAAPTGHGQENEETTERPR